MICKNCKKEIGPMQECNLCGYDPSKDEPGSKVEAFKLEYVAPPAVKIKPVKVSNGPAKAGFVLCFIGLIPYVGIIPLILSFIFSTVGFFKAKNYRSGRVRTVIALIIDVLNVSFWAFLLNALFNS